MEYQHNQKKSIDEHSVIEEHWIKKFGVVAICILLILGIGVGIFFLVNKQKGNTDEVKSEPSIEETLIKKLIEMEEDIISEGEVTEVRTYDSDYAPMD